MRLRTGIIVNAIAPRGVASMRGTARHGISDRHRRIA